MDILDVLDILNVDPDAPVEADGRTIREIVTRQASKERDKALSMRWRIDTVACVRAGFVPSTDREFDQVVCSLIVDLMHAFLTSPTGRLSVSRRKGWWSDRRRFKHTPYGYARIIKAIAWLVENGLATEKRAAKGEHLKKDPRQTVLEATPKLVEAFKDTPLVVNRELPSVMMRAVDGVMIALDASDPTLLAQTALLEGINRWLQGSTFTLPDDCGRVATGVWSCPNKPGKKRSHTNVRLDEVIRLTRIFNRGSWEMGGRFYSPYQQIPSPVRKRGLLNGEKVVEVDFKAFHPSMLAAERDVKLPDDPYKVSGFAKDQGKLALIIMFNARNKREAVAAIRHGLSLSKRQAGRLYYRLIRHNHVIADAFGTDAGIRLMRADSEIALHVIRACMAEGIVCLPVHDSFIVQERHEIRLRQVMDEAMEAYAAKFRSAPKQVASTPKKEVDQAVEGESVPQGPHTVPVRAGACARVGGRVVVGASSVPSDVLPSVEEALGVFRFLYGESWAEKARESDEAELRRRAFNLIDPWSIIPTLAELRRFRTWSALRASLTRPKVSSTTRRPPSHPWRRPVAYCAVRTPARPPVRPAAPPVQPGVDPLVAAVLTAFPGALVGKVVVESAAA